MSEENNLPVVEGESRLEEYKRKKREKSEVVGDSALQGVADGVEEIKARMVSMGDRDLIGAVKVLSDVENKAHERMVEEFGAKGSGGLLGGKGSYRMILENSENKRRLLYEEETE